MQGAAFSDSRKGRPRGQPLVCGCRRYRPFTIEQWVEAVPCAGIIEPGVAADNGSRPVLALEFGIVGERVMRYGGVGAEGRHLYVADAAAFPLAFLALQIFD